MSLAWRDRIGAAALCAGLVAASAGGWLLLAPGADAGGLAPGPAAASGLPNGSGFPSSSALASAGTLVVDVQGGVAQPGIVSLPAGSRVADALQAAGGYAEDADLAAAAGALNLAAVLSDGEQVYVPVIGVAAEPGAGTGGAGSAEGGLVNLNTATPEALEALPGIGPVTVQKIVAARAERVFTTLDELVERKVMNRGQLDDIRDLVTL